MGSRYRIRRIQGEWVQVEDVEQPGVYHTFNASALDAKIGELTQWVAVLEEAQRRIEQQNTSRM